MTRVQNILISCGAFWLSLYMILPLAWIFGRLNDRIIYGDGVLDAIAMGTMTSLGRSCAAALAGAIVCLTVAGKKPERWAFLVAILYVVAAPVRYHWNSPATQWDRLWQGINLVFPAFICVASAFLTMRCRRKIARGPGHGMEI
jgi:hypothetical protein